MNEVLRVLFVIPGVAAGHSMVFARRQAAALVAQGFRVEMFDLRSRTSLAGGVRASSAASGAWFGRFARR